jgi:hypothetical protein
MSLLRKAEKARGTGRGQKAIVKPKRETIDRAPLSSSGYCITIANEIEELPPVQGVGGLWRNFQPTGRITFSVETSRGTYMMKGYRENLTFTPAKKGLG